MRSSRRLGWSLWRIAMKMIACSCHIRSTSKGPWELCPMHGHMDPKYVAKLPVFEGEVMQDKNTSITLSVADSNQLRRLLGWIACEIGQAPEEIINTFADIAPALGPDICQDGQERIAESYEKSKNVPKYIWAAIKALRKKL